MRHQTFLSALLAIAFAISHAKAASAESLLPINYSITEAKDVDAGDIVVTGRRWEAPKPAEPKWEANELPSPTKLRISDTKSAALRWEMAYLALTAVETMQTIDALHRGVAEESNPLMGKNPTPAKLILGKIAVDLVHFYTFKYVLERSPKTALRMAQVSAGLQGTVVALNARFTF